MQIHSRLRGMHLRVLLSFLVAAIATPVWAVGTPAAADPSETGAEQGLGHDNGNQGDDAGSNGNGNAFGLAVADENGNGNAGGASDGSASADTEDTSGDAVADSSQANEASDAGESTETTDADTTETTGECPNKHGGPEEGTGGPYDSTCDGSPSGNGNGDSDARPCAGCVGNADNVNPSGQLPGPEDHNNGYECDGNSGIARTNPAHSGCQEPTTPPTTPPPSEPQCPDGTPMPPNGKCDNETDTCPDGTPLPPNGRCEEDEEEPTTPPSGADTSDTSTPDARPVDTSGPEPTVENPPVNVLPRVVERAPEPPVVPVVVPNVDVVTAPEAPVAGDSLARTGFGTLPLLVAGLMGLASGAALVRASRSRLLTFR